MHRHRRSTAYIPSTLIGMTDESFAYGEFDPETFATIMEKINQAFGHRENGCFYDLGCGAY